MTVLYSNANFVVLNLQNIHFGRNTQDMLIPSSGTAKIKGRRKEKAEDPHKYRIIRKYIEVNSVISGEKKGESNG